MNVLFVVPYPTEGASNRYRVEQYLPYLEQHGIRSCVRPFVSKRFFKILYKEGHYFEKIFYFLAACLRRISDLYRAFRSDVIFIHREACPVGPPLFEWCCRFLKKPIIFDFDDAIFLPDTRVLRPMWCFLKCPWKVKRVIRMSRTVIVSNHYLEAYARKYHEDVLVIPTVVDPGRFQMKKEMTEDGLPLVIGWVGTVSTARYLEEILPVFEQLAKKYRFVLRVVGSPKPISVPGIHVENQEWSLEKDCDYFPQLDIGVYPLPDDSWALGKAAFKAIQYMASGIPVVASPVGMNREVVQDGVNGFLASTQEEWFQKLSLLVEKPSLRRRLGEAGRKTVETRYASRVYQDRLLNVIKNASSVGRFLNRKERAS